MSLFVLLGLAAFFVLLAALTGIKPSGTKPVSSTRLMTAARIVLVLLAVIFGVLALTA
jgi:hypothetical protein